MTATALTFDDEFNTLSASATGAATTWMTQYPYGDENASTLTPNGEQEYYSPSSGAGSPFSDSNGVLNITASPAAAGSNPYGLVYTSGLLTTYKSFSQTYGYFEVNAKLPAGQGLWPAFWMLPADNSCSSELDVFEMLGSDPSTIHGTTHGSWYSNGISQAFPIVDTSKGFNTYGVDWEPSTVTFYVDGQKLGSAPTPSNMNGPLYMLLNLAVGGASSWGGAPNGSTSFPATMSIDYVRAYATAATTFSGGMAATNLPVSSKMASQPSTASASTSVPVMVGSGPDTLALMVNEDAWNGDARFTISVDGALVGGMQTATASHSTGVAQEFDVKGTFAPGTHTVSIDFLNDAYGGSPSTDRNLYVIGATLNGTALPSSSLSDYSGGNQSFDFRCGDGSLMSSQLDTQNGDVQSYSLFNAQYYLANNPDVAASTINPLVHYETFGAHEGRDPNPLFDDKFYFAANPDVAASTINPLLHFELFGAQEGRNPDQLFDTNYYLAMNPDVRVSGVNPLLQFEQTGAAQGRNPSPLFNTSYYLARNPDVAASSFNPLAHFEEFGWREGRNPDALFDVKYYLAHNPDVAAAGIDPLVHYDEFGWREGRNPSAAFSTNAYLKANPDVKAAGVDPLAHYVASGQAEGRAIYAVT